MAIISDGNNRTGDELSDKHVTVGTVEHTGSYVVSGSSGNQLLINTASMSTQYAVAPGGYFTTVSPNIGVFENANGVQPTIAIYRADDTKSYGGSFGLARASSTGSVGDGDALGFLGAAGHDGTRMVNAAEVSFEVDGAVSTDQVPGSIKLKVNDGGGSSVLPSTALIVKSDGKVGIGTESPSDTFHVVGASRLQGNTFVTGSFNVTGSVQIKSDSLVNQKSIKFDGLSPFDEVTISDATTDTSFSSGGGTDKPFTISMWVNLEEINFDGTNAKHQGGLYTKRTTSPSDGEIFIGVASGHLQFILYADPDQNGEGSFSTLNRLIVAGKSGNYPFFHAENTWFHVCITYDGSKTLNGIRIYKNSHPVGQGPMFEGGGYSTANPSLNVPNQVFFGTSGSLNYSGAPRTSIPTTLGGINVNDNSSTALAGKLADVCRFNRVLTHTEVQELYNGGKVKNMEEHSAYSDLEHWWKMGDHIDTIGQDGIKDYVGGYHGTLGGDASIVPETSLGSDVVSTWSVNSSGSLGVGTIKPDHPFHVIGSSRIEGDLELISGNTTAKSFNKLKTKSISFDGTDDYIEISDHDDFTFSDGSSDKPFSIQAWIKIEDTATDEGTIISKYNANTDAEWLFWQDNGVIRLNLYDNNESPPTVNAIKLTGDSASLTNDTWHHVVVTYDGSESHTGISAYVDGSSISATTEQSNTYNGMVNTTVPVQIGGTYSGTIDFEKRIGSVAVFTKELTAAEVLELYNDGKVMNLEYHSAYSKILSWWKMGDDQDTTGTDGIKDYVNSHHGTLNGNASIVDESDLPSEFLESFRINTAGNVGIGTTTPEKKLHVYGDTKLQGDLHITGSLEIDGSVTRDLIVSSSQIKVTSAGPTSLFLEADTDDTTETDTAYIKLSQDGGIVSSFSGLVPANGKDPENNDYTDAVSNSLLITSDYTSGGGVIQLGTNSAVKMTLDADGDLGIGTNAPRCPLHIARTLSGETFSNANLSGMLIESAGSSNTYFALQVATVGGGKCFSVTNAGRVGIGTTTPNSKLDVNGNTIVTGSIKSTALGNQNEIMIVGVDNVLSSSAQVKIDSSGRIAMQATSDPSTATNYAHIYSKDVASSAEVFVRDEAGNVTQISPHNDEGEWQYFSRNVKTGKVVKVNMEKMIRRLEEITGESFMEEWYEDPTE